MEDHYIPTTSELRKARGSMDDQQKKDVKEREGTFRAGEKEGAGPLRQELKGVNSELKKTTEDKEEIEKILRRERERNVTRQLEKLLGKSVSWSYIESSGRDSIIQDGESFGISLNDVSKYETNWSVSFLGHEGSIKFEQIPQTELMPQ